MGIRCMYDLPIGYWQTMRNLMQVEKEINPEWAVTIGGFKDSEKKLARKNEEIAHADKIIVASNFTLATLNDYPGKLPGIHVVPYGFPPVNQKNYKTLKKDEKVKLLFVGGLSQRKGLSYLFNAVEVLKDKISLTIIGKGESYNCNPLSDNLSRHTWIETLPHEKILEVMRAHDILILPSLFEGFGLVITEAMAQGTPVITTERTAGPDIIQHNENGWIIKAGCTEAIINILGEIVSNPDVIEYAGKNALETATRRPWSIYGSELVAAITTQP
ncbi:MAG: glycosyltransferase family 4 protein [Parafilimonas sp.]|nr:glycosyltransferase family 4 protein [Parafilimonas sp.]